MAFRITTKILIGTSQAASTRKRATEKGEKTGAPYPHKTWPKTVAE
jgi:hypothetical protein